MEFIRLILIGIAVGMANVIPGVSGGTLAVVFNIYDKFINAITLNLKKLKENWKFTVPLLSGMVLGILIFSKLISILYKNFPVQTNYFFTGLILGSIPLLFNFMIKSEKESKLSAGKIISIVLCAVAGFAVLILFMQLEKTFSKENVSSLTTLPAISFPLMIKIFVAGFLGAVAMIIPGISGSLLMLIMGVYPIVMYCIPAIFNPAESVHAILLLLPNGIGVISGLLVGAQFVKFLLNKVPNHTYAVIFGLLCGSIFPIFPGFAVLQGFGSWISSILCVAGGIALAYCSTKFAPEE